ncbi:OmpA family protein [Hymenobacter ruricola]|uniref:OmpA family protein n=1 Tax=Hymenobacter ruricola TaxID=2791023 RepID=A0ABS0I406_9BACT|nr:OmpA family protein [Hymenobacter ruricola]MBF9221662.1 OmpA family protein [Hymenobacter ruricola]
MLALLAAACSEQQPTSQTPDAGQHLSSATGRPAAPPQAPGTAAPTAARPPLDQGQRLTGSVSDLNGLISDLGGKQTAAGLVINFSADVLFDFDKADLKPEAQPTLEKLAQVVQQAAKSRVLINGYTDAKGDDAYNLKLSEQRAQAIADWLSTHTPGAAGQTQVKGYGEANPVAPNTQPDGHDNPEGRQQNRRVEVIIS